jgi:hypothetical protein
MALDFQQMQSGLEVAALAKFEATDDTEVVVRDTRRSLREGRRDKALPGTMTEAGVETRPTGRNTRAGKRSRALAADRAAAESRDE